MRLDTARAILGYAAFAAGAMVTLTLAAAGKVAEALFAVILYCKPLIELVGAPKGALRHTYSEAAVLTTVAVMPAFLLMLWVDWSPSAPLPHILAAVLAAAIGWAMVLMRLDHPLFQRLQRLLRLARKDGEAHKLR